MFIRLCANPNLLQGGCSPDRLRNSQIILWHGFCSVHKRCTVQQIGMARLRHPGVRVLVHPECTMDVVDAANEAGSTDYIRNRSNAAERDRCSPLVPRSTWCSASPTNMLT